ncbi:MAG: twin-arginine translocase TatA/TatE family subunit [Desulfomonilaceae bacterium]
MGIPAPTELILILLIVVLVFGGKKIPEIMGGVAQGIKTFKKALDTDDTPPTPAQPAQPAAPIEAKPVETDKSKV